MAHALTQDASIQMSGKERRTSARHISVLQFAKLLSMAREELCIVRDISATGLKAEVYCPLEIGDVISVEFRSGTCVAGKVVWADGKFVGIQFDKRVAPLTILAQTMVDRFGRRGGRPRLQEDLEATLRIDDQDVPVRICDVSPGGMRVSFAGILAEGKPCEITTNALRARKACIRWYRDGEAGLLLSQPMTYPEFVGWRKSLAARFGRPAST